MRRKMPGGGGSNNGGGYNNQNRGKPRYQNGGGGHSNHNGGGGRPRRNYPQLREKALSQARDALASGDRVLAENYFQYAEHYYRMMVEEGSHRPRPPMQQDGQQSEGQQGDNQQNGGGEEQHAHQHDDMPTASSALPSFITGGYQPQVQQATEAPVENWEDRDSN